VALAGAALLLTGCAGARDDGIATAGSGGEPADAPEPTEESEPEDEVLERPAIEVGPDLELVFEDRETGDPVMDAVLLDNEWQLKAVFEVLTTHDQENSSVAFYTDHPVADPAPGPPADGTAEVSVEEVQTILRPWGTR
jgi:hypothetical protein